MSEELDKIYNKLCVIFFLEEARLEDREQELFNKTAKQLDSSDMVELIEVRALKRYFKAYMIDVLKYIGQLVQDE